MLRRSELIRAVIVTVLVAGCGPRERPVTSSHETSTLTIGYGLTSGARTEQAAQLLSREGLVLLSLNGRSLPWLAESWSVSDGGLKWRFQLRQNVTFHDGP